MKKLLVIFQATRPEAESLALALGLGAVQGGADIRFRHLNPSPEAQLQHREYGILKAGDFGWAECLAIFLESELILDLDELTNVLVEAPGSDHAQPKRAIVVSEKPRSEAVLYIEERARSTGILLLQEEQDARPLTPEQMNQLGRHLASLS